MSLQCGHQAFRLLTVALKPVLPEPLRKSRSFLNIEPLTWADLSTQLPDWPRINQYTHIVTRIEPAKTKAIVDASKENLTQTTY